jgi:nitroreductase
MVQTIVGSATPEFQTGYEFQPTPISPHPVGRRGFLKTVGAVSALVAVGATGAATWRAVDQGVFSTNQGPAYEAWLAWNDEAGGVPLNLVRAAVLAANAHNSQPWLFRLAPNRIELYAATARNIGTMDPLRREMYISLGCALENLLLAADAHALSTTVQLMPDSTDATLAARVDLAPGASNRSALYEAIPKRHTNRAGYAARSVGSQTLSSMEALIDMPDVGVVWLTSQSQKRAFSEITNRATAAIIADPEQAADDFAWYQGDWSGLQAHKDGLTLDTAGVSPLIRTVGKVLGVSRAQSDQGWVISTRDIQLPTAASFGVLVIHQANDNAQRIQAGRVYQRMQLWATGQGLAMQPLNQAVERADREQTAGLGRVFSDAVAAMIPQAGWHAVMPFRIGYPTVEGLENPRRPAEDVVVRG